MLEKSVFVTLMTLFIIDFLKLFIPFYTLLGLCMDGNHSWPSNSWRICSIFSKLRTPCEDAQLLLFPSGGSHNDSAYFLGVFDWSKVFFGE